MVPRPYRLKRRLGGTTSQAGIRIASDAAGVLAMTAFGRDDNVGGGVKTPPYGVRCGEAAFTVAFPIGGPNSPRTSRDLGPPGAPMGGGSRSETNEVLAGRENEIGC